MVEISAVSSNELCEWLISQSNECCNMRFDYIVLFCFVFSVYLVFHLPLQGQKYSIMGLISKLSERICESGKTSGTFLDCSTPMERDLSHSY